MHTPVVNRTPQRRPSRGNYSNPTWSAAALAARGLGLLEPFACSLGLLGQFDDPVVPALAAVDHARTLGLGVLEQVEVVADEFHEIERVRRAKDRKKVPAG